MRNPQVNHPEDAQVVSSRVLSDRQQSCTVVISSAGRRVALLEIFRSTLRTLGVAGRVLAAEVSPLSAAFHRSDEGFLVPPCTSAEFVPAMLELCRAQDVGLIIPTIDTELAAYASHRHQFAAEGVTVAVSSPEVVAIGSDKVATHAWLVQHGFPTVNQATAEEVLSDAGTWTFPLLVKPRTGNSSRGVAVVGSQEALEVSTRDGDYLVQTIAEGTEHTVDILMDRHGRCRCAVPRRRLEVRAGEVSKGVTVNHQGLEELATEVAEALPGARGVLNLQVFATDDGELSVIELNPRFGGGFPLSWAAGADYPRWLVEETLGLKPSSPITWRADLVMLRYDDAVLVEAGKVGMGGG